MTLDEVIAVSDSGKYHEFRIDSESMRMLVEEIRRLRLALALAEERSAKLAEEVDELNDELGEI